MLNKSDLAAVKVQDIIDAFYREVPGAPFNNTVDTIKAGDRTAQVSGVVTTMFPTMDVIQETVRTGANFIIAHEPSYYSHLDETDWLEDSDVYKAKRKLLDTNRIVIWRCHDSIHRHEPDGVRMGVLEALGWQNYYDRLNPYFINIPATDLQSLTAHIQKMLGIPHLKVIGDDRQQINKVALSPGAAGGKSQIGLLQKQSPDAIIVGEINEWETAEYIRDARSQGKHISLIVLGHSVSEEPGMEWMANWVIAKFPSLKVVHIKSGEPFRYT